tara:strand:+ start:460 stop:1341 length:882 start_codon:yes stop_codon:yes gene_type:complete
MNKDILKYITNTSIGISSKEKFVAIIGGSPSKGARSPKLWNAAFKKLNRNIKMYPLDVNPENLKKLINFLGKNKNFLGGAVTVPYKEKVYRLLQKNSTREAKKIEAVNCLYRNNKNILKITNTDGEASIEAFKKKFKKTKVRKILVIGCGGAGKAVSTYFASLEDTKKLTILSRKNIDQIFAKKIKAQWLHRKKINEMDNNFDLIINCTTLGFNKDLNKMPLSKKYILELKKKTIIYDIIYKPLKTKLIKSVKSKGIKFLNGLDMNLYQAALAFNYVNKSNLNLNKIKKIMKV